MITLPDRLITIAVLFVSIVWLRGACACSSATFNVAPIDPSDSITTSEEPSLFLDGPETSTETTPSLDSGTTSSDTSPKSDAKEDAVRSDDTGFHPGPGVACTSKPPAACAKFACDESADCGGGRCCLLPDNTGSTCDCSGGSMDTWIVLCQSSVEDGCDCQPYAAWPGHGRCT